MSKSFRYTLQSSSAAKTPGIAHTQRIFTDLMSVYPSQSVEIRVAFRDEIYQGDDKILRSFEPNLFAVYLASIDDRTNADWKRQQCKEFQNTCMRKLGMPRTVTLRHSANW